MSNHSEASEDGALSESTYEFIDTDGESQNGNATESIASTDFGRPDDEVASLADTEEDSGDEEEQIASSVSGLPGHDQAVEEAFNTPTIGRSSAVLIDDLDQPLAESIEFEEPFNHGAEIVSVKHTVADYDEETTAETVKGMKLKTPPKRLLVTICQTMTMQGLSTKEPLRILYIGSHSAKEDIVRKIASSVTASVENRGREKRLRHSSSQLYNVVPITAFGSERTPEIELMQSSGYQIKVENCVRAEALKFEDTPDKPDVIKLTLDDNYACHSVPGNDSFIIEPSWELPHVAIVYCSDSDSRDAIKTRTIARKFMSRHRIPSIVISHRQLFDRGQCMSLDQHSIHMCLESRDAKGRGNIVHQRLPIDLASFLNIDARQMNRNLAYLTGLHELSLEPETHMFMLKKVEKTCLDSPEDPLPVSWLSWLKGIYKARLQDVFSAQNFKRSILRISAQLLLVSIVAVFWNGVPSFSFSLVPEASISVNSKLMSPVPVLTTTSNPMASMTPSITSSLTAVAMATSTRTVTVTKSMSPGPNSLAVVPSQEIGKLGQVAQNLVNNLTKSPICSAEALGDREILIRIPSATKFSWFTKDSMFVNITRGNATVDTERLYSSDEGIVLLLPKKEAYGVLNISIVTTKKPRVNETFQVDFGTSAFQSFHNMVNNIMKSMMPDDGNLVDTQMISQMRERAEHIAEEIIVQSQSAFGHIDEARRSAIEQTVAASANIADFAKSMSLDAAKRSAQLTKEIGFRLSEVEKKLGEDLKSLQQLREPLDTGILSAQIQAKLLWLKLQGKDAEHEEYARKAAAVTRRKAEQTKAANEKSKKEQRASRNAAKKEARAAHKSAKKGSN